MELSLKDSAMLGYCTNVHAGATYAQTLENLDRYATAVRAQVYPGGEMGVGLWLAADVARELVAEKRTGEFRDWLKQRGLRPFTLNGFPYGDFHQPVVKHRVYQPTWAERARLDYTIDLVAILHELLPDGDEGSISTLPLGWRSDFVGDAQQLALATKHLVALADHLAQLERETGRLIHIALEPEPGCYLDTSEDVVSLFRDHLLPAGDEKHVLRYLRVCHDVCHAAVMFEDQASIFKRYRDAGIRIGKVQLSSAISLNGATMDDATYAQALQQMHAFAEDRYLHQTVVRSPDGEERFYEDLPLALADNERYSGGEWRVHFHVPLFVERFGALDTTQSHVSECMQLLASDAEVKHYEVETYAWGVLPEELRNEDLADGIAREMQWVMALAVGR